MSKCDYCDNTNSCRTCGLTYDDGVKDGRKQAIKELVNAMERRNRPVPADRLVRGAVIYAVDVLERKFADDLSQNDKARVDAITNCIAMVVNEPPVKPTQNWIPVSERLPEEEGDYLLWGKVCEDEEEYQFIGSYDSGCEQFGIWEEQFDRTTLGCLGSEFFEYASVIAWMPLPKPYKTETESEV